MTPSPPVAQIGPESRPGLENRREIGQKPGLLAIYLALMKPKIVLLLLITTAGAMFVAAGDAPDAALFGWTMLAGALSAGGANAINHYLDRDIDVHMGRTSRRPLPAGWARPRAALLWGILLSVVAFLLFATQVNLLAALLSLSGGLYYIFIYTLWLKRRTHHNITIGGVAGAIPPLVGWAAITGGLDITAWGLFAIVFFWTPPHTWALTLVVTQQYARVDVPMLPVVVGEAETRRLIVLYAWAFVAVTVLLAALPLFGGIYLATALVAGAIFMRGAYRLRRQGSRPVALSLYKYSLLHLALLFAAMAADAARGA
ncbi:MAG: protoheme IX farnesyltransferase [Caldilineales bacterium]|nr:protoheme IX farnesyltransferase [Caldilineales bacterium]